MSLRQDIEALKERLDELEERLEAMSVGRP